jgi:hypothetical protein
MGKHTNFQEGIKERFMTKPTLKNFAVALDLLGPALIASACLTNKESQNEIAKQ